MKPAIRRALTLLLLMVPLTAGLGVASAFANVEPTCSQTESTSFPVAAIQTNSAQGPTNVDFVSNYCFDADSDPLSIVGVASAPTHGTLVVKPADPANGFATDYVEYTPTTDFVGRDAVTVSVSDGTATVPATLYLHVVSPDNNVECGPTYTTAQKRADETAGIPLNCYNPNAPEAITYAIDSVSPVGEASHVVQQDVDNGGGTLVPGLSFDNQIAASQVTVQVTATVGTNSDTFFVVLDNQHDPACTAVDSDGIAVLAQHYSDHAALTQDLGCADPDATALTYGTPSYQVPNDNTPEPGSLVIDQQTGIATFTPTNPDWTGVAFWSVDVSDGNNGATNFNVEVSRYQTADVATTVTAPASVVVGTDYTVHLRIQNHGPDPVTGSYFDLALPAGSVHGTLPAGCASLASFYVECSYPVLASLADFTVDIPATATATANTAIGSRQIGVQYGADNFRDNVPANDATSATVEFLPPTVGTAAADVYTGNGLPNTYSAGAGNDRADGGGGNDTLIMGGGADCAAGGAGSDFVDLGTGNDVGYGDAGPCVSSLRSGATSAVAGGNDRLYGRAGADRLYGGAGNDLLYGGIGSDVLYGGTGSDLLSGGAGNDRLYGGPGKDRFVGGGGNDVIYARDHVGGELISCGPGRDTVYADRHDRVARDCERVFRR
ncbi:MAG: secreted agglutinin [Marmoricola sp.]|nr:secreted agglutinin [Marmoricola sp.]